MNAMQFLHDNGPLIMLATGAIGAGCDLVGHSIQPGTAQRILLGIARLFPANFVGAFRAATGQVPGPPTPKVPAQVIELPSKPPPAA